MDKALQECMTREDVAQWLHNALAAESHKDQENDMTLNYWQPKLDALTRMREIALEEAADVAENTTEYEGTRDLLYHGLDAIYGEESAKAIRALKDTPNQTAE